MIFKRIEIGNFKSFRGRHDFDLTQFRPGLNFLTGRNQLEPELGANGVGKSTLWDALHWVLYGKTLDGLRAEDIHSWSPGPQSNDNLEERGAPLPPNQARFVPPVSLGTTWGLLEIALANRNVQVFRSWKPNALEIIEGTIRTVITQEELEDLLKLGSDSFQQCIIIGQRAKMFFDLRPAEKLTQFTEIMDLDFWQDLSRLASDNSGAVETDYSNTEREVISLNTTIEEVERALVTEREASKQAAVVRKEKLTELGVELKQVEKAHEKLLGEAAKLKKELKERQTELQQFTAIRNQTEPEDGPREKLQRVQSELSTVSGVIRGLEAQSKRLDDIKGKCPVCGQEAEPQHLDKERSRLSGQIKGEQIKAKELEGRLVKFRSEVEEARVKLRAAVDAVEQAASAELLFSRKLERANYEIKGYADKIKSFNTRIEEVNADQPQHEKRIEEHTARLSKLKNKLNEQQKELHELEALLNALGFWVKGFKDIRLTIIEGTLDALGVEVNNYLAALGMENWLVKFDVERETKGGTVSRGFQVFIQSLTSPAGRMIPLEAWSGGEGQRLRIACTMGLANLILDQRGIKTNLQVWDEPLYGLSGTGIEDMIELLQEQARDRGKQIWLIDHRTLEFGFDRTVSVRKDQKGSHIEV